MSDEKETLMSTVKWVFSGAGVALILGLTAWWQKNKNSSETKNIKDLPFRKLNTKVLFVDDDTKFKVISILKKAGWSNVSIVKDLSSLDSSQVTESHILFIDVQGVGVKLGFREEGLGLAVALKEKYPKKKIIIYSNEKEGDRFHKSLRKVDDFLAKNADPIEFQTIVEDMSETVFE